MAKFAYKVANYFSNEAINLINLALSGYNLFFNKELSASYNLLAVSLALVILATSFFHYAVASLKD